MASDSKDAPPAAPSGPDEDMKAKFREALDRKHGRHAAGAEGGHADAGGKASHTSASAAHQKEFRRKSGG